MMGMRAYFRMVRSIVITEQHLAFVIHVMEPVFVDGQDVAGFSGKNGDFQD
ncbi:MAG: hypothetical protein U5R49_01940 [Deltaproteobacteria bacterium]|nr:hypothetical protein [Deltaproteobacteria bacterium]